MCFINHFVLFFFSPLIWSTLHAVDRICMPRFPYDLATNQFHPDFHLLHACPHLDLPHRCTNKSECEIQASNSLFGNPCPDSSKYLEVHYRCISYSDNGLSKYPRSKLELLANSRNFRLGNQFEPQILKFKTWEILNEDQVEVFNKSVFVDS